MDDRDRLSQMTAEEKAALVSGTDFMYTNPIPRLGIGQLCMADGPHGLRKQAGGADNGVSRSEPATAFPTASALACGWNPENARRMGAAIAEECRAYGVGLLLGPGVNIQRNPLCGRNFEYFSEDPLLAGELGAAEVAGLQSRGVGAAVKHFALNNSENYRFMGNSIADARAMREIYLKPFEIVVRKSAPAAVMCAYNRVNGVWCSENTELLQEILRGEWGFDGAVMTDWGAMHDRPAALRAGLDLEMPGDTPDCRRRVLDAAAGDGETAEALDRCAANVLRLVGRCAGAEGERAGEDAEKAVPGAFDPAAHHALAAEIAEDCAVLLKNDGTLPLDPGRRVFAAGELFTKMRYQGAGSSMIAPTALTSPRDAFAARGIGFDFCRGYTAASEEPQPELIAEALERAADCPLALVFAGLTDADESEGADRAHMRLPAGQLALIDALIGAGKKLVVVLFGGAPVELPFADSDAVGAVLYMALPGQNGGTAAARLLFGDASPRGKLAQTWPRSYEDVPFGETFGRGENEVYKESVYVGYRYYLTAGVPVRYPFGFGLSYTSFAYENLRIAREGEEICVSCEIANTGERDGAEVVQLYVGAPQTGAFRPCRELRAFAKVFVRAGEKASVRLRFPRADLRAYDALRGRPAEEPGVYGVQVCSDSTCVRLAGELVLEGGEGAAPYPPEVVAVYRGARLAAVSDALFERMSGQKIPPEPPVLPIRTESRFSDLRATFFGRILFRAVLSMASRRRRAAEKLPEGEERDNRLKGAFFLQRVLESNSLRTMSMCAGRRFPFHLAEAFAHIANGRLLRGVACLCRRTRVPPLPKEKP